MFKNRFNDNKLIFLLLCLIIVVQSCFMIFQINKKQGFFIDEIYSYGLSNSVQMPYINKGDTAIQNKWVNSSFFDEYLTVQHGERFDYKSVYTNQAADVHPPFYYAALHTICSFFPDSFSKWQGEILNLILFIICEVFLFLLAWKVFKKDAFLAFGTVILYGCSIAAVDTLILIRMYMMLTMWAVISFYLHYKLITEGVTKRRLAAVFAVTYLGCLTQYYFLVLSFFIAAACGINMIIKKQWKNLIIYGLVMAAAVGAMIATFPFVFEHLFGGGRVGKTTLNNASNITDVFRKCFDYAVNVSAKVFAFPAVKASAVLFAAAAGAFFARRDKQEVKRRILDNINIVYLFAAALCIFAVISLIGFDESLRYMYYIIPVLLLLGIAAVYFFGTIIVKNRRIVSSVILAVCVINGIYTYAFGDISYWYEEEYTNREIVKNYSDCYGIMFCEDNSTAALTQECLEVREVKELYTVNASGAERIDDILSDKNTQNGIVIWVDVSKYWSSGYNSAEIINSILNSGRFSKSELLYKHGLAEAYYIN